MRKEDASAWLRLAEKVDGKCFLIADVSLGVRVDQLFVAASERQSDDTQDGNISDTGVKTLEIPDEAARKQSVAAISPIPQYNPIPEGANGVVIKMDGSNLLTIGAISKLAKRLKEKNMKIVISSPPLTARDTFPVDLTLGTGANALILGGVLRAERSELLNHWYRYSTKYNFENSDFVPSERKLLFNAENLPTDA